MRADPNQFNIGKVFSFSTLFFIFSLKGNKPKPPTAPPKPPGKTAFHSRDIIRGSEAMFNKFSDSLQNNQVDYQMVMSREGTLFRLDLFFFSWLQSLKMQSKQIYDLLCHF